MNNRVAKKLKRFSFRKKRLYKQLKRNWLACLKPLRFYYMQMLMADYEYLYQAKKAKQLNPTEAIPEELNTVLDYLEDNETRLPWYTKLWNWLRSFFSKSKSKK